MTKKLINKDIIQSKVQVQSKSESETQTKDTVQVKTKKPFIHDTFFKDVYSKPKYSLDIFRLVFSKKEQAFFNWNTLKIDLTTFMDKELSEKRVDLLFSVNLKSSNKSGSSLKNGQLVGIIFHTPQGFYCQEQSVSSSCYKTPQYNQNTLFLSQLNQVFLSLFCLSILLLMF